MANSFQVSTTPSGPIQWTYPFTEFAGVTPSNAHVSGQPDASLLSTGPGSDAVCPGSSIRDSSAIDLRPNNHLGIDMPSDRSYDINVRDYNLGGQSSSQPQSHTYQQHQNNSSQYNTDLPYAPARAHNLVDTQRRWSAPDISIPRVGSSLQHLRYPPQNQQDVSPSYPHTPDATSNNPGFDPVWVGSSTRNSSAIGLRPNSQLGFGMPSERSNDTNVLDHNHLGVQSSSHPQSYTYQQHQNDSLQYYPDLIYHPALDGDGSHNLIDTQRRWSAPDIGHGSIPDVGSSLQPLRHLPQNQQDVSSSYPHIPDSTSNNPGFDPVWVGSSTRNSSAIGLRPNSQLGIDMPSERSYDTNVLDHNHLGVQSSSHPQSHTYQQHQNNSSQYYPDLIYHPALDGDGSHNLIDTRRRWSAPDIRHGSSPHVGSSLQHLRYLPQNQQNVSLSHPHTPGSAVPNADASGDVLYPQATGLSAANFGDNSYHGVGLFSQPHRRSIGYSAQRNTDTQLHHPVPVVPSTLSPANANVGVPDRFYLRPASWSSTRDVWISNMPSLSTGLRRSSHREVNFSASLPTVEEEAVGFPTTSVFREPSPTHIPQGRRERVPLRTPISGKPRDAREEENFLTIDFETEDRAMGSITPGTYFADHLDDNPDRLLVDPEKLPFKGKPERQFTLEILVGSALLLPHVTNARPWVVARI